MPYLQLITNVAKNLITDEFTDNLRNTLAKTLGEQKDHIMIYIEAGNKKTYIIFITKNCII